MNNLKYYNDSVAYDFDLFMPREAVETVPEQRKNDNVIKLPRNSGKKNARRKIALQKVSGAMFAIVVSAVMITALFCNIALRLKVNEVNSQVNKAKSQLNTLNSEFVSLQMEYESCISYANLEMEAAAIGMKKLDKDQVVYIRVNDKSIAKTEDGKVLVAEN